MGSSSFLILWEPYRPVDWNAAHNPEAEKAADYEITKGRDDDAIAEK